MRNNRARKGTLYKSFCFFLLLQKEESLSNHIDLNSPSKVDSALATIEVMAVWLLYL